MKLSQNEDLMLGEQFYVKSDETRLPVIFFLFCRFFNAIHCVSLKKLHHFFTSVYFCSVSGVEMSFWVVLVEKDSLS